MTFKRVFQVLYVAFALTFAVGLMSCGSTSSSTTTHCTDFDYPLYCPDSGVCCPRGSAVYCDGHCFAADPGGCVQIDSCVEE